MARILISYFRSDELSAGTSLAFFESFSKELEVCGNEVLLINNAYYGIYKSNQTKNKAFESYLLEKALAFNPELIITFNHMIFASILEHTDVPVVIYDGDELRYFADLPAIRRNLDRYTVFSIVREWRQDYLDFGFREEQIHYMPPGTSIHHDLQMPFTKNISFLGQRRFFLSNKLKKAIKAGDGLDDFYALYMDHITNKNYDYSELIHKHFPPEKGLILEDKDIWPLLDQSYLFFAALMDLGLYIGGHEGGWKEIVDFAPQLAMLHHKGRIFSLKENQDFYNSSKISLCPMHPQAQGKGFSWRCLDIMASNAAIVSSTSTELRGATKGYVDLPMFDSPGEVRDICQKLLQDEGYRREIVSGSQRYVDEKGRWIDRIRKMEGILGISLVLKEQVDEIISQREPEKLLLHPMEIVRKPQSLEERYSSNPLKQWFSIQSRKLYDSYISRRFVRKLLFWTLVFLTGGLLLNPLPFHSFLSKGLADILGSTLFLLAGILAIVLISGVAYKVGIKLFKGIRRNLRVR